MLIQLTWKEPATREIRTKLVETPLALGRILNQMPEEIEGAKVSRVVLQDDEIAGYHALIVESGDELIVVDQNPSNRTLVNGVSLPNNPLGNGDVITLGIYKIKIEVGKSSKNLPANECDRMVGFLFKRRCGRTNPVGCDYCKGRLSNEDPYLSDRAFYPEYGQYNDDWGRTYYYQSMASSQDSEINAVDFTEADSAIFEQESDVDFEGDFGAS